MVRNPRTRGVFVAMVPGSNQYNLRECTLGKLTITSNSVGDELAGSAVHIEHIVVNAADLRIKVGAD